MEVFYLAFLKFNNVSFLDKEKIILKDLSLDIENKDFISIVGPSGSGKSTFLKLCCNLISPSKGNIFFNGEDLNTYNPVELRKKISYCFQNPYLFGDTIRDNLTFSFNIRKKEIDEQNINNLFERFKMSTSIINENIPKLSGGEKQRIALIRTLLFNPDILLLDEVTSALDADNAKIVENVIEDLNKNGITIIWVTHNLEQSRKYANKLLTIEAGQIKSLEVLR
jgi:putative ABC transport system ATP-binding protein